MEMVDIARLLGMIFGMLVVIFLLIQHLLARRAVPTRYEWLTLLTHVEWKSSLDMKKEMSQKKKVNTVLLTGILYGDLVDLEEEKLIESREVAHGEIAAGLPREEYRLTRAGFRKKNLPLVFDGDKVQPLFT